MYNPALPNYYNDVKLHAYFCRRDEEEDAIAQQQRQPNAIAAALASSAARLPASSMLLDAEPTSSAMPASSSLPSSPSLLSLTAEELHQQRVKQSAVLGVQRAVEMEKEAFEVEHKKRRMEGSDARSLISTRLAKLKSMARPSKTEATAPSDGAPSSSPSSEASSGLVFAPSSLAGGGYVMQAPGAAAATLAASRRRKLQGRPSSTLLLRYFNDCPLERVDAAAAAAVARADGGVADELLIGWLEALRRRCSSYGIVRAMTSRLYTPDRVEAEMPSKTETNGDVAEGEVAADVEVSRRRLRREQRLHLEQLRVFVRYDSVAEAFKAGEQLLKETASVAEGNTAPMAAPPPLFSVYFYPSDLFDAGQLDLRAEDWVQESGDGKAF